MKDILVALFSIIGSLFILIASLGMLRMPDLYLRVSVATKAVTLGVGCLLFAVAIHFFEVSITTRCIAAIFFLTITAPIAAHVITRVSYLAGIPFWKRTKLNEFIIGQIKKEDSEKPYDRSDF